ncbi:MAG: cation diffusion facilitator family transporter [Caldilinea sp. CFX5]|nr:cation diffusion facilitator family transporter [Caldilinea sp. CFX5]
MTQNSQRSAGNHTHDDHNHNDHSGAHGHTHGIVDPGLATTERGIWAIKWSFVGLMITALLQVVIVYFSGSVALLSDTIHNLGDATTAIPLWIAFALARRCPSRRFTYGYGKVEDLAGVVIVLIILFSAVTAGYEALQRLWHPQPVAYLGAVVVIGLLIAVAILRIVWDASKVVFVRLLDGIDPTVVDELHPHARWKKHRHAACRTPEWRGAAG